MKKFWFFLFMFIIIPVCMAGTKFNPLTGNFDDCITFMEEDGSPENRICGDIKVSNMTLTDNGDGTYSLSTGGGGGGGGDGIWTYEGDKDLVYIGTLATGAAVGLSNRVAQFAVQGSFLAVESSQSLVDAIDANTSDSTIFLGKVGSTGQMVSTAGVSGGLAGGYVIGSGATTTLSGTGGFAWGRNRDAYIDASEGALAIGSVTNSSTLLATGEGGQAFGYATDAAIISSDAVGAMAMGWATNGSDINAAFAGSLSGGTANDSSTITTSRPGALAFGNAQGGADVRASEEGCIAMGYATGASGEVHCNNDGSVAMGYGKGADVDANGDGAIALGLADSVGAHGAAGMGSVALGHGNAAGTKTTAPNSFAIGKGMRNIATAKSLAIGFNDTQSTDAMLFVTGTQIAVGTTNLADGVLLDLSSTDRALRVTRLADPSAITSLNGMIAYDSTDNELQGYIGGAWVDIGGSGGSEVNNLETIATGIADDEVPVGSSADTATYISLPDCDTASTSKLLYDQGTNAFSCGTDQDSGGATAWDDIGDPDANKTIDMTTFTTLIDLGGQDTELFSVVNTDSIVGAGTVVFKIGGYDDNEADLIYFQVVEDDDSGNEEVFKIGENGSTVIATDADGQGQVGMTYTNTDTNVGADTVGFLAQFAEETDEQAIGFQLIRDTDGTPVTVFEVTTNDTMTLGTIPYTLPPDDGDVGEQLQTNGSGTLTWEAAGAGGSGDEVTVNSSAVTSPANFLDNTIVEFDLSGSNITGTLATDSVGVNALADVDTPADGEVLSYQSSSNGLEWIAAGGSGAFSDASDPVVLNTTTKDVVIGAAQKNTSKLTVDNEADQVGMTIQGHSTQTNSLLILEQSDGTDALTVSNIGDVVALGNITADAFIANPSATPSTEYTDSDTTDEDVSTQIQTNCTDTGSGTEDCDLTISQQIAGVLTAVLTFDADGDVSAQRNITGLTDTKCITIESLAAADDDIYFWSPDANVTLVNAWCHCSGTCTTEADITLEARQVGTASTVDAVTGTVTCEDEVTGDTKTALSGTGATVDALDIVRFDTGSPSPETDTYQLCVEYTVD